MRTRKILIVVAVALLLGTVGAMAQDSRIVTLKRIGVAPGQMYDRTGLVPKPDGPDRMPVVVDSEATAGPVVSTSKLDAMGSTLGMSFGEGGALIAPRGGAMSTPQQLADREIRRLIRRLD